MVKFSIIVPVYNVEEYIANCLDSILKQSYENYEVIIVNDGTKDDSQKIIDKYVKKDKRFKSFIKENGGLSDARNYGIKKAVGDYFLLVDSDDSINKDLLKELNEEIEKNDVDLIKFGIAKIMEDNKSSEIEICDPVSNVAGINIFSTLLKKSLFVTAWSYAYKTSFWKNNKFEYSYGRIHEDFGLTPYVVIKAKSVSVIDYVGYNYYIRNNSIMTNNEMDKLKKKNVDSLYFFDLHMERINGEDIEEKVKNVYRSYVANALINRSVLLDGKMLKDYLNELKIRNISDYMLSNTMGRKVKKMLFKMFPKFYVKHCIK